MNKISVVIAFCLMVITACSATTKVDGVEVKESDFKHYRCDDEKQFDVAFLAPETAVLRTSESLYRLVRITSGSGEKYILDDNTSAVVNPVTLFTKGEDARLEVKGIIYKTCSMD